MKTRILNLATMLLGFVFCLMLSFCGNKNAGNSGGTSDSTNVADVDSDTGALILTNKGLGHIKMGMTCNSVKPSEEGFYANCIKKVDKNDMDGDSYYLELTDESGNEVARAYYDLESEKIFAIEVYAQNINTKDGLHPGSPISDLLKKTDIKWEYYLDTGLYAYDNNYTYIISSLKSDVDVMFENGEISKPRSENDFVENAKIENISASAWE